MRWTGESKRNTSSTAPGQRPVARAALQLVGMARQEGHAVADEVHGGLEPGLEQQHRHAAQLVVGQPTRFVMGGDERGEDVVAGVAAQCLEVLEHPGVQRVDGALAAAEVAVPYPEVDQRDRVGAPPQELLAHGPRRPQHLGDDGERKQGGVVTDQVHRGPRAAMASRSSSAISSVRERSAATARAEKARAMSLR